MNIDWITVGITALITALPSAIIGGFVTHRLTNRRESKKKKEDLKNKELMIQKDLKRKVETLHYLKKGYENLDHRIKNSINLDYADDAFNDLHSDVYRSVAKSDLFQIFQEDFITLADVYMGFDHLREFSPYKLKSQFISVLGEYNRKHKDNWNKKDFEEFIKPYIEHAAGQIELNFVTINDLYNEIDFLLENIEKPKLRAKNPKRKEIEIRKTIS